MDRMHWQRIEELFELAHAQPIEARRRFLADDVAGDMPALLTSIDGSDSVLSGLPARLDRSERVWE